MKNLIVYGCGGHARSVAEVALANGKTRLVFVDSRAKANETIFGFPVVTSFQDENAGIIIAIGDNEKRASLFGRFLPQQCESIVAHDAYFGRDVVIGRGSFVGHGAYLGPGVTADVNSILNTRCVIEHESRVGAHCHIAINATVAGRCQIGDFVTLGAGVTVIDNISICSNVFVGAGATVTRNLDTAGLYVGVPARKIK